MRTKVTSLFGASLSPAFSKLISSWLDLLLPWRRLIVVMMQAFLVVISYLLAFVIRCDDPFSQIVLHLKAFPLFFILRLAGLIPFGLYAGLWRYVSITDLCGIVSSVALSSTLFLGIVRYLLAMPYPGSVVLIDSLLLICLLSGIRLAKRLLRGWGGRRTTETRILIIGAGDSGEMLVREIERHPAFGYRPLGFIDDDPRKQAVRIRGVRVLGTRQDLKRIIQEKKPDELLIAIPSASSHTLQEIVRSCRRFGLPVKSLPGLRDILFTRGLLHTIKDIEPEDLLCRPPILLSSPELQAFFKGRVAMITGAGGSIGSELVRQLSLFGPSSLVLYERHEYGLYKLEQELTKSHPNLSFVPVIGDILDSVRLSQVLDQHKPSIIFHAAAYKHVPMMECNPHEAVKVNILGTKKLAKMAMAHGVEKLVFISSDKAVNPANVMGATKRVAELLLKSYTGLSKTKLITVRFGNVLESSGSVVPLFKEQIRRGGPVTITHPEVTRYFMTTAEAVHLVLHSAILGEGGEIFVLDMGHPILVLAMARQLISLYGYEPGTDIQIVFTGLRPGEKLHEELFNPGERVGRTGHPKIMKVVSHSERIASWLPEQLPELEEILSSQTERILKSRLNTVIENAKLEIEMQV